MIDGRLFFQQNLAGNVDSGVSLILGGLFPVQEKREVAGQPCSTRLFNMWEHSSLAEPSS
jgi:hypothetical protein